MTTKHQKPTYSETLQLREIERNHIRTLRVLCDGDQSRVNDLLRGMVESVLDAKMSMH